MDDPVKPLGLLGLLVWGLLGQLAVINGGGADGDGDSRRCKFPAVYNFGDSNSDTGAISATLSEVLPPNGESFFGHPAGRACDGRLVIDFIGKNKTKISFREMRKL